MTDERRADEGTPSPWWSGTPRDVWAPRPTPDVASDEAETTRYEPIYGSDASVGSGSPDVLYGGGDDDGRFTLAGGVGERGGADDDDPWARLDTFGREAGPARGGSGPRTGLLVALAAVVALLAGAIGGGAGYLLADRSESRATVDGASLGAAPAGRVERPAGSIPGVAARVLPSVVQIKVDTAQGEATGSGFVVDETGVIVTNNHVVDGAQDGVELTFSDGTAVSARVVGKSASYDLAVLRFPATDLPALPLGNSDSVAVGDQVLAVGSPLGLSGTVTSGIISAKNRPVTAGGDRGSDSAYINAIQTDAAINPGNSGGPLVNLDGEVIGVNSAIATVGGLTGESGNIGVGFAIPINQVRRTVEQLLTNGEAEFPIIGASLDGTYSGEGARIAAGAIDGNEPIVPGGPAEQAGLEPGDVILALDGEAVAGSSELIVAIRSRSPGDTITLTVRRDGAERTIDVVLGANEG